MSAEDWGPRLEALEARLHCAEGHAAILDLKSRYGALMDARYTRQGPKSQVALDGLAEQLCDLFSADAVWEAGGELGTAEGRAELYERFRRPSLSYSWHFFVKPTIRVEAERAFGRWDVLAMMTTTNGRAMWMVGVEEDEYAYVDGLWLHTRMKLDSKLMAPYDRGWGPKPPEA